jgi:hypothetical protein
MSMLAALVLLAQVNVARVADDAIVLDRVAEMSKRDLPSDLLKRMVNEDIDLLRGKRADGTFEYATYERLEANRTTDSFSINPSDDEKLRTVEMRGAFVYRVILDSPSRRMLVTRNRPVWVERVDVEYLPVGSTVTKTHSVAVGALLQPGEVRPIDLPDVARQATVRVHARTQEKSGYGNVSIALVHARVVDRADSPYADAVSSAKAVLRALDNNDVPSIRAMARRMGELLGAAPRATIATGTVAAPAGRTVDVTASRLEPTPSVEIYLELQAIEDLLTGSEAERREGLDRLHQLVRRLRR